MLNDIQLARMRVERGIWKGEDGRERREGLYEEYSECNKIEMVSER